MDGLPMFTKIARENPHRFDGIYLAQNEFTRGYREVSPSYSRNETRKGVDEDLSVNDHFRVCVCIGSILGKYPHQRSPNLQPATNTPLSQKFKKKHRTFLCTFLFSDPKDHSFSINYKCNLRGVAPEKSMMRSLVPCSRSLEIFFPALQRQPNKTFTSKGIPYSFGEGFLAAEWGRCFFIPTSSQTKKHWL